MGLNSEGYNIVAVGGRMGAVVAPVGWERAFPYARTWMSPLMHELFSNDTSVWQSYSASSLEHLHISGFTGPSAWGSWSACPNLEVSDKEGESHPCKLTFYATRRAHTL
eukprot:CAMPEP_0174385350 /NCGR_PEP_ID=MMETSP0811_2-20130205/126545_1 /TAXON_ID=73025 ORGANISM="Eutreptiella gymnastica-like, Strain CCMP1594" /NCGR_SAMPLE_ID=MMETSP0811_2 /ASSEMBLY_ACC=CAM_ASM_000667 /LENGTH=108 /DNA_ID=CAMNT_0015539647 /DNA_START=954 /DNA_END=1278 /DNA_ORIENTATION=+